MDNPDIACDPATQRKGAAIVRATNERWAQRLGIRTAARLTTVKPEGTGSLWLGGIASGHHQHHAERYFRRVTGNVNEVPVKAFMSANPHMIEHKPNGDVCLVFPIESPKGALCIKDVSALEFVQAVMSTFENWVQPGTNRGNLTHNVSCTVTLMTPDERGDVVDHIWQNRHTVAAMSFVPGGLDKMYPFCPREEVITPEDETYWNRLIRDYTPVDWSSVVEEADNTARQMAPACSAGGCEE